MSTEKILRVNAKKSLLGNMSVLTAAVIAILAIFLAINSLFTAAALYFKIISVNTFMPGSSAMMSFVICFGAYLLILFMLSPFLNGFLKMLMNTAVNGRAEARDFLYFFSSARKYFKTLAVNSVTLCEFMLALGLLNVSEYISIFTKFKFDPDNLFSTGSLAAGAGAIVTVVIGIILYFIFIHFPLMHYALDDSLSPAKYMFGCIGIGFKNLFRSIKLFLSFTGWILLCFFVLPAFYVIPYMGVSFSDSARWLIRLEQE